MMGDDDWYERTGLGATSVFGLPVVSKPPVITATTTATAPVAAPAATPTSTYLLLAALGLGGYLLYRHYKKAGGETVKLPESEPEET